MRDQTGRTPTPEEIAAIEWEARRLRAQVVTEAGRSLYVAIRRLLARTPPPQAGSAARA